MLPFEYCENKVLIINYCNCQFRIFQTTLLIFLKIESKSIYQFLTVNTNFIHGTKSIT